MPGFECGLHGRTFLSVVCPHIDEGITTGAPPKKIIRMGADYGFVLPYLYCPVCAERYGYPSENTQVTGDEFERLPEVRLVPVCADCFREARHRQGMTVGVIPGGDA